MKNLHRTPALHLLRLCLIGGALLLLNTACDKEETLSPRGASIQPEIITGYFLKDQFGLVRQEVGTVNTNICAHSDLLLIPGTCELFGTGYPNPSVDQLSITVENNIINQGPTDLWLIRAASSATSLPMVAGATAQVDFGAPLWATTLDPGFGNINLTVNTTGFPAGFYRLYVRSGDLLVWDNLLINAPQQ